MHHNMVDGGNSAYIALATSSDDDAIRSAAATVSADVVEGAIVAIVIPRRGHGYEISYPKSLMAHGPARRVGPMGM